MAFGGDINDNTREELEPTKSKSSGEHTYPCTYLPFPHSDIYTMRARAQNQTPSRVQKREPSVMQWPKQAGANTEALARNALIASSVRSRMLSACACVRACVVEI